tara:strand:+ start:370 stop:1848 length:1479 start_codon:yes stop_codon:yes gene_type:complete
MNNTLSNRQNDFVAACFAAGLGVTVTRAELVDVCESSGIYSCPPSWITQDSTRKIGRGEYNMPEIAAFGVSAAVATTATRVAKTDFDRAMQTPDPEFYVMNDADGNEFKCDANGKPLPVAAAPAVKTVANHAVMGMTGGERSTLVPSRISTYVPWGHFKSVEMIVKAGIFYPTFITGLSGNGKTTMIEQVCAKMKRECYRINITRQTDEDDLLGGFRLINGETVWQDGPVVQAMKSGAVLLLDEIDLASHNIMCLQPVLEGKGVFLKKTGQWVTPAAGFTVFATANTKGKGSDDGKFIGTNVLNEAFLDRFPITMEQAYAPRATEKKILIKAMTVQGIDDADFAENLVKWSEIIRKSYFEGAVDEIISTRRLVDITKALAIFGDKVQAIDFALSRFDDDTKTAFRDLYAKVDAEVGDHDDAAEAETAAAGLETADRVNLACSYDQKDLAKSMGAKWDSPAEVWYVSGDLYRQNPDQWAQFNPAPVTAPACPF